jgi:hypothetical protein
MREHKGVIIVAAIAVGLLVWWAHFVRNGGDLSAAFNKARIAIAGDSLARESRALAGLRSTNCGTVPPQDGHPEVTDCAERAFNTGRPFRVRYDTQGIDSLVSVGFVRTTSGQMFRLIQDDSSYGTEWSLLVRTDECAKPLVLKRTEMRRLRTDR